MASSVDARRRIKNAPLRVFFVVIDYTDGMPITGGLTTVDAEISADGGAFADLATAETEIGTTGYGYVDLTATETAYDSVVLRVGSADANAVSYREKIEFEKASDSGVAQSATAQTIVLRAGASATDNFYRYQQIEIVRGTGAGQRRNILSYVGSSKTVLVDLAWATNPDNTSVYIITDGAPIDWPSEAGQPQSATTYAMVLRSGASAVDDIFNGQLVKIIAGTGAGQMAIAIDYVGSSKTLSIDRAWVTTPDTTSVYVIGGKVDAIPLETGLAQSATSTTVVLRSGASATNDLYNGNVVKIKAGTGAGQERTVTDYVGSSKTCTVDRAWITNPDATSLYVIDGVQGGTLGTDIVESANATQIGSSAAAATALAYLYKGGLEMGAVNDAGATTTVFIGDSSLSTTDDFYNGALLIFVTGTLAGVAEKINDYVGSTRSITMDHAFPTAPSNTDQFVILGKIR